MILKYFTKVVQGEVTDFNGSSVRTPLLSRQVLALLPGFLFTVTFIIRAAIVPKRSGLRFTLFDDAMISMTYARTLADAGEWVWYPGADRVQGFTNPLWTLYMAAIHAIGLNGSSAALAISLTGIVILLSLGILVGYAVTFALPDSKSVLCLAPVAGGTVLFIYPLVYWTLRGMEVGLLALLSVAAALVVWVITETHEITQSIKVPLIALLVIGVAGILVRMDFLVILGPLLFFALFWAPNRNTKLLLGVVVGIPIGVTTIGILLFQSVYWGDWLTNTYRLKVEGFSTHERVIRGLATTAKVLPLIVLAGASLAAVVALKSSVQIRRLAALLAVVGLTPIVYSIWVGGDAWEGFGMANRYVAVGIPALLGLFFIATGRYLQRCAQSQLLKFLLLLVVVSAAGNSIEVNPFRVNVSWMVIAVIAMTLSLLFLSVAIRSYSQRQKHRYRFLAVSLALSLVAVAATSSVSGTYWFLRGGFLVETDQQMTDVGLAIRDATKSDAVIAVHWAGAPAYYAQRSMIDLLGKTDREIATGPRAKNSAGEPVDFFPGHSKYDANHSVKNREPDIVATLPWDVTESQMTTWGYSLQCDASGVAVYVHLYSYKVLWEKFDNC